MGLSRLENFLRSVRGNIIYVDPNALDSTDSIENTGSALTRPFKTIQRALIEAARFSYLPGLNNDKFGNTTVVVYPGDHIIDNRPGWIPLTGSSFQLRNGQTSSDFNEFDLRTNFDVTAENNALYKFNSVHGGVIIPRGTSIVGMDLRKTKIRPKYVPDPADSNIQRSSIFQVTGACYIWQLSIFDADPNGQVYKDYTDNTFVPNYSHHKLTAFQYADGANNVVINDTFVNQDFGRTDLDIYYEKIGLAYGPASERNIPNDFPAQVDIETKIDEFRIVGSRGAEIGITSIRSGDGVSPSGTITVTLESELEGLAVDTPIRINGVTSSGYNGQFTVKAVNSPTEIQYATSIIPTNAIGGSGGTLNITVDTVTSASPYIHNCSLRSVYGMCGLHADGSLVEGFKSIVVAQFTGISLQKDNNAFVKYDPESGTYLDTTSVDNIYSDSLARYKPEYENFHIKASNNAFIQCVSIFAIGYAQHFDAESGGDMSITNSNSNFGAKSLISKGFSDTKFNRDDVGYVSHIIPPKHIDANQITIEFDSIDITKTTTVADTSRLYLYNQTSESAPPENTIDGYRIGAKLGDTINFISGSSTYSAEILMPGSSQSSYQKSYNVAKSGLGNNIANNIITFTEPHDFETGETVRLISNTGELPDNTLFDRVYYAINISSTQIKLASSLNDATNGSPVVNVFSNESSDLSVVSRVSDKNSGDKGHPIQWDTVRSNWYIQVKDYTNIGSFGLSVSPRTFINRIPDTRNIEDTLYKFRYVIPKDSLIKARPPVEGFVIQESTDLPLNNTEVDSQYILTSGGVTTKALNGSDKLRNTRFIASSSWSSSTATITTELPHRLKVGTTVEIRNILSANNSAGTYNLGFNGSFVVASVINSKKFTYALSTDPGSFINNTATRTTSLPYFNNKTYTGTYYIYRSKQVQEYIQNQQDGIYYLTVLNSSNKPNVSPYNDLKLSQSLRYLYQQIDRDNPNEDPESAKSFALPDPIGQVTINNAQNSITKETLDGFLSDSGSVYNLASVSSSGIAHTFTTNIDHGLNPITKLSLIPGFEGFAYGTTGTAENLFNGQLVGSSTGENATINVRINASGQVTNFELVSGGSGYQVGDELSIVGLAITTSHSAAKVRVDSIYNHVGETLRVTGITSESYSEYNNLYRITGISSSNTVNVESLLSTSSSSINTSDLQDSIVYLTGKSLKSTSSQYNSTNKKLTLLNSSDIPFAKIGQKVRTVDNSNNYRDFVISNIISSDLIVESADNNLTEFSTTTDYWILPFGYSSEEGDNLNTTENRIVSKYAGITTVTTSSINPNNSTINIANVLDQGFKIGDYLEIEDEIVRISQSVRTTGALSIIRGSLGTKSSAHPSGVAVRKVYPFPIEFRRYSILRASGHTFEYVGFGPGNYSNSLPERQDREITNQEELLSQSFKENGGVNVYTGMNNDGDFYIGNKKVNPATGQEEVFDSPFQTVRGEDSTNENNEAINVITTQEINVSKSIKVEGGSDGNIVSQFNGPVVFNDKITSNSVRGIEGNSLFLQGNATISRKYSVGSTNPTLAGNSGDVEFYSVPTDGGYLGWVYTENNAWRKFGPVQNSSGEWTGTFNGTFNGTIGAVGGLDSIWSEITSGPVDTTYYLDNVGIGTSVVASDTKLSVKGKTFIDGLLNVTEIIEKATIDVQPLPSDPSGIKTIYLGDNNVYYFTQLANANWTINFSGRQSDASSLSSVLQVGDSITVALVTNQGAVPYYNNAITIDGSAITARYYGGLSYTSGNANSTDVYTYVIIRVGNTGVPNSDYRILASQSNYA